MSNDPPSKRLKTNDDEDYRIPFANGGTGDNLLPLETGENNTGNDTPVNINASGHNDNEDGGTSQDHNETTNNIDSGYNPIRSQNNTHLQLMMPHLPQSYGQQLMGQPFGAFANINTHHPPGQFEEPQTESVSDAILAKMVEIEELKQIAENNKATVFPMATQNTLALVEHLNSLKQNESALFFLELLCGLNVPEPKFTENECKVPPRSLSEEYIVEGKYELSQIHYYDTLVPSAVNVKKRKTLEWSFQSTWMWKSEQMHDAHLAETIRGVLNVNGARVCEYFSYNKPYHQNFGGGRVDQRWIVLHRQSLRTVHEAVAPNHDLFSFLLFMSVGCHHVSKEKGVRYSLYNLIAQAGAQNIQVPYRQVTIVMSDERGDPKKTRQLGADPHSGNPISQIPDNWNFGGWSGCDPPPPSVR